VGLFITWLVLSMLVGFYAASKGHSGVGWFLLSLLLSPLLCFIIELIRPPNVRETERRAVHSGEMKKCPACAELVRAEAVKCRYCGEALAAKVAANERVCGNCMSVVTMTADRTHCGVCGEALGVARDGDAPHAWGG
jgi:hypothetical protein